MAYSMAVIFFVELLFSFLPNYTGQISALVAKFALKVSGDEVKVRSEIAEHKSMQAEINMTDDFVTYARLQRKVDKLTAELKQYGNKRNRHMAYLKMGTSIGVYVFHAVMMLILMIQMRSEPLMMFPEKWLAPVWKIVAFPTGIPGAVGFGCWVVMCHSVIRQTRTIMGV